MKISVGDKVRVKTFKERPSHWNSRGFMDHMMGKTVEVISICYSGFEIYDEKHNREWVLTFEDVEPLGNECIIIKRSDNKVIATDQLSGKTGVAKCCPEDEFDFAEGAKLAFDRLMRNMSEPANDIKVGDNVKIVDTGKMYSANDDWVMKNVKDDTLRVRYAYCDSPYSRNIYELPGTYVVRVIHNDMVYVQRATTDGPCYLINVQGLERC